MDFITFLQHITHIIAIDLIHFMCEPRMCVWNMTESQTPNRRWPWIYAIYSIILRFLSYFEKPHVMFTIFCMWVCVRARLYLNTVMVTTFKEWSVNGFEIKTFLYDSIQYEYVMLKHYSMLAHSSKRLLLHDKTRHKHSFYFIIQIEWHASLR